MSTSASRKATILAVDDQPGNLVALQAVLQKEYELVLAKSGAEAISILGRRHDISVVLMDLQMPGMDGFEAASRVKKIPGCENIPIIFITALYKEEPFVKKGYQVGAVDYFSKPFDPEILKMKIEIYASFRQKLESIKEREMRLLETEKLIRAGRKFSAALEDLPVGVIIADIHGQICQTNDQVAKICKIPDPAEFDSYGEVLGWWDAHGRLSDSFCPLSLALANGEITHNSVLNLNCLDGTKKNVLCSASPLLGPNLGSFGAVVVVQDISESKKIAADIEEQISHFMSADAARSLFG